MSHRETYRSTLTYALSICGASEQRLAERLGVPVGKVVNWLAGVETVPTDVFMKAVDIVLGATSAEISQSRELLRQYKKLNQKDA